MLSDLFIRRPILASVCSLVIILAGAISIPSLPIARYPDLTPPAVSVAAAYTVPTRRRRERRDAAARAGDQRHGRHALHDVVEHQHGRCGDHGDVRGGTQSRPGSRGRAKPRERRAGPPAVRRAHQRRDRVEVDGGVSRRDRHLRAGQSLRVAVPEQLRRSLHPDALKRVPGVGNVIIFGERKLAMRLWLDPSKLAGRGLTASDVVNALREQNVQVAAGTIGDEPAAADQQYQLSVRAQGRLNDVDEFANVVVKAGDGGALIRVKDLGRVELGAETYATNLRFEGLHTAGIGIQLLPNANAIQTLTGVIDEMDRLQKSFPPGMEYKLAFDNVSVVRESIIEVLKTLLEAIGLVILVMFLFLQNWRSTVIPAVTIPVSLIGTFAFVKVFGFSINTLTLFGVVLATGIVVDDAIVVIENIERHMRDEHKGAFQAAIDAMRCGSVFGGRRHRSGAGVGVRARGVLPGHDGPDVSAVLGDDCRVGGAVGVQRHHVHAGAGGFAARSPESRAWMVFHRREPGDRRRHESVRANVAVCGVVEVRHAGAVRGGAVGARG